MNKEAYNDNVIEVEDVHVNFTVSKSEGSSGIVKAVDGITLSIGSGETLAVVGESGCGKTTFGKAVLNIIKPSSGAVLYRGKNLSEMPGREIQKLRQKMQLIFQDPYESLDPRQNVYKTLLEPLSIHRKDLSDKEKQERIYKHLEAVGFNYPEAVAGRYPHHLSGGQRQRLSIASVMILEPDFVVADEPVSMLDVSVRAEILKLMLDMQATKKLSYMFITHDLSLAWMIADRIAVFNLGKMMEIGPANEIVHHGLHPYTKALVSVIPTIAGAQKPERQYILTGETPSPMAIPAGCRFHTRCWLYKEKGRPAICREQEPELQTIGKEHQVACHFAGKEG